MTILKVHKLSVAFPTTSGRKIVLRDISLEMQPGEVLGLVGESGSGKSMTANAIVKILPPKAQVSGEVVFDGTDLLSITERKMRELYRAKRISMIFQDPWGTFNPVVSIGKQIERMFRLHKGLSKAEAREATEELLKEVHIPDKYGNIAGTLSGGQLQRASIARMALVTNPDVLIADEITTALDVTVQAQVLDLLVRTAKEKNIALLFITHDFGLVAEYADRVVVLENGSVVEQGSTEDIFYNPQSKYVQGVLKDLPSLDVARGPRVHHVGLQKSEPVVLSLNDVHVSFPVFGPRFVVLQQEVGRVRAIDGISLDLHEGEILGVVGESGSGKTTLLRIVLGVLPKEAVSRGSITLGAEELTELSADERRHICKRIGGVAQNPTHSLNPRMQIGNIIGEGLDIHNLCDSKSDREMKVEQLMRDVGLREGRLDAFTKLFSGGELQRIAIARALATDPEVLILDEPTSSLDASRKRNIMELLLRLRKEKNLSYILITHELATVAEICDRVAVMYLGKIVEIGNTDDVFSNPLHPYTRALLDAVPIPDPKQARARDRKLLEGEVPSAMDIPPGCSFSTRCPFVQESCSQIEPTLEPDKDNHFVACPIKPLP